jgi:hypothetical protein
VAAELTRRRGGPATAFAARDAGRIRAVLDALSPERRQDALALLELLAAPAEEPAR